jgi:hypothetical protein
MPRLAHILLLGFALAAASLARAQAVISITFDDIAAGSQPAEQYAGLGVHFGTGPYGVVQGLSNGDPGNWGVDGTAGPYFLGFNGPYTETITFDTAAPGVSLDVSRTNGSSPSDTFTLTAFAGATQVGTQTITLATINVWQTVTIVATGITSITLADNGTGFAPFGIDNLKVGMVAVPEPSAWLLLALGLPTLGWFFRRRLA